MHIHSGERPYTCDVCNKAFINQSNLIKHQRIRIGEHPYGCEVCKKAFSKKNTLITHQCPHCGERLILVICVRKYSVITAVL